MSEEGGFFSRWSRRKQDLREGRPLPPEPAPPARVAQVAPADPIAPAVPPAAAQAVAAPAVAEAPAAPAPTLDDVQGLTAESDFRRFVAPQVAPEVKNAAMKKLFADPHFNVMDGLDVYIDDYSKPDPLPLAMARQLASAQFLNLFDEDKDKNQPAAPAGRDDANNPAAQSVAQCQPDSPVVPPDTDAHADLRLQQDDAAGRPQAGPGTQ